MKTLAQLARENREKNRAQAAPAQKSKVASGFDVAALTATSVLYRTLMTLSGTIAEVRARGEEFAQARTLHTVLSKDGASRSLLNYIDASGNASRTFQGFPAVESLDQIGFQPDDRRNQRMVASVAQVTALEAEAAAGDITTVVKALVGALKALDEVIDPKESRAEALSDALDDVDLTEEVLAATVATAIDASAAKSKMEVLVAAASSMSDTPDFVNITEEKAKELEGTIKDAVEVLQDITGLVLNGGDVGVDPSKVSEEYSATQGTLAEKGYNADNLASLLRQLHALIDALEHMCERVDEIEAGFLASIGGAPADEPVAEPTEPEAPAEPVEPEAPAPAMEESEDDPAVPAEPADEPDVPVMVTYDTTCRIVCGYATIMMALIDSCNMTINEMLSLGEVVAALGGAEVVEEKEEEEKPSEEPAPEVPAAVEEPVAPAVSEPAPEMQAAPATAAEPEAAPAEATADATSTATATADVPAETPEASADVAPVTEPAAAVEEPAAPAPAVEEPVQEAAAAPAAPAEPAEEPQQTAEADKAAEAAPAEQEAQPAATAEPAAEPEPEAATDEPAAPAATQGDEAAATANAEAEKQKATAQSAEEWVSAQLDQQAGTEEEPKAAE